MTRVQPDAQWQYLCGKGDDDGLPYVVLIDADGKLVTLGGGGTVDASSVTYTPADASDWDGGVDPGSQADADDQLASRVKVLETDTATDLLPCRYSHFHECSYVAAGNAIGNVVDTAQVYNMYARQNVPANNDETHFSCVLKAGAYTIRYIGVTSTSQGKLDTSFKHIDDAGYTSIATGDDWYSAVATRNVIVSHTFTVITPGRHIFKLLVNGKNAASAGYFMTLTKIDIYLTVGDS